MQDLDLVEFFENANELDANLYRRSGIYPIHGVIAVRNDVLRANPDLAKSIFSAFTRARDNYWSRVKSGAAKGKEDLRYLKLAETVGNPLPYGLEENLPSLEALIRFAHHQKLLARAPSVNDAFFDPRNGP